MTVQNETASVQNGVDVDALLGARTAMEDAPDLGLFTWRARAKWAGGTQTSVVMDGFYGLCEEQTRGRVHKLQSDHPEHFAADDKGATPVEIVLAALAGCLGAGVASVAQHRGIQLHSVEASVEGDMDMAGIMGIDPEIRNGFTAIRIDFQIDADANEDEIAALIAQSQKRSAVYDIITNPTNVHATATKVERA